MKNFALIGVGGYVAPRHLSAIKETGNKLMVALDKNDSVGVMDAYFPNADFFTEPERFERHIYRLRYEKKKEAIDYFSICTPNYLHDSHIRMALRNQADAICEKPLVLNPWNVDALTALEKETGKKIYTILQLRHHPVIVQLKDKIEKENPDKVHDIDLTYITGRGKWYHYSWKGDEMKSGGLATNIGIHFFDMLQYLFGEVKQSDVFCRTKKANSGFLHLEKARVRWFLSIDTDFLPKTDKRTTYRSITIDGEELDFTDKFVDLHTISYENILSHQGFGLNDARQSIEMVHHIRNAEIKTALSDSKHPFLKNR